MSHLLGKQEQAVYKIRPLDRLFLKGADSNDAGINFHTKSIFPPYPSSYGGLFQNLLNLSARDLSINWNGLLYDNEPIYPLPLDIAISGAPTNDSAGVRVPYHVLDLSPTPVSHLSLPYIFSNPSKKVNSEEVKRWSREAGKAVGFLTETMDQYLEGDSKCLYGQSFESELIFEEHTGIAINTQTGVAETGLWYTQESVRLGERLNLGVDITKGHRRISPSIVPLGGDRRQVHISQTDVKFPDAGDVEDYFKLYLATPAIFKHGIFPRWIDPDTLIGTFSYRKRKVKVKLLAAAIGKPGTVGSFDLQKNKPLPTQVAVPAGSVYYFKLVEGNPNDAIALFHRKNISDYRIRLNYDYPWYTRTTYCDRGYGHCFVGNLMEAQLKFIRKREG